MKSKHHSSLLEGAPEHLKAIGLISVNWSLLEGNLSRLLCFMLGIDWPAARAILPTGHAQRRETIRNLAMSQNFSEDAIGELNTWLVQVKTCAERRNEIMHSYYGMGVGGVVMHTSSKKKDVSRSISLIDLQNLADDIADCYAAGNNLPAVFYSEFMVKQQKNSE